MAIPESRYVDIRSENTGTSVGSRNLQTLVFTKSTKLGDTEIVWFYSATAVGDYFGAETPEAVWAERYFSYSFGGGPRAIGFARYGAIAPAIPEFSQFRAYRKDDEVRYNSKYYKAAKDLAAGAWPEAAKVSESWTEFTVASGTKETAKEAFVRVASTTSNFGSFTFLDSTFTMADAAAVASSNASLNYRFLFSVAANSMANCIAIKGGADKGQKGIEVVYQNTIGYTEDAQKKINVPKTYIISAIMSAIDWSAQNGTVSPMYRQIPGEVADVDSELTIGTKPGADELDRNYINYYGQTQTNGRDLSFYQKGMNFDGEPTLVYMGEVWLKSEVSSRLFDLLLSENRITPNQTGRSKVFATVDSVCSAAKRNGVIEPGKSLSQATRLNIYSMTGDVNAADIVEATGYYLTVWFEKEQSGDNYVAKYLLVYSKNDVAVKVEGTHSLK